MMANSLKSFLRGKITFHFYKYYIYIHCCKYMYVKTIKEIWSYLDLFSLSVRDRKWMQTNKKLYMKKQSFDLVLIGRGVHLFLEGSFYDKCLLCFSHLGFKVYRESISQIQNINFLEEENNSIYIIYYWHIHNTYIHTQFYVCMGIHIKEISLYNPTLYSIWKIYILLV